MKKLIYLVMAGAAVFAVLQQTEFSPTSANAPAQSSHVDALQNAYRQHRSNVQVKGEGRVAKVLPDDLRGSRHQRFLLRLASGQTILIAHNIDLARKISQLKAGDKVAFYGEYEYNDKGGVVHWTHVDPGHRHVNGWLRHKGVTYQ